MAGRRTTAIRPVTALPAAPLGRLLIGVQLTGLLLVGLLLTGCTDPASSPDPGGASVPEADRAAIDSTVAAVNATAGSTPADQRTVLEAMVDPARLEQQRSCTPAVTTIRFEPAWPDLRRTGDGRYVLPTLIRIYNGTRITGTDVGALDIVISAGQARLPPLCVG